MFLRADLKRIKFCKIASDDSICGKRFAAQEQREELKLAAFVLDTVNKTALQDALNLTPDDVAELRSLLRDDHHGICLIIRLMYRHNASSRRTMRRCSRSIDRILYNRAAVKTAVGEMLSEVSVMLSNLPLQL